jgi:putative tricarboxylic transport membrane protein
MFVFGILGYAMDKYGFPLTPLVLGIILGPITEKALVKGVMIYDSFWPFFTRPISGFLLALSILSLLYPVIRALIVRMNRNETPDNVAAGTVESDPKY